MSDYTVELTGATKDKYIEQRFNKENKELMERISEHQKENERQFKEAKKLIGFSLRGNNKYYYANQCAIFARNYKKYWEQKKKNSNETILNTGVISFNKYSINMGLTQYHSDLKRFNSKEEMLGYVVGYNEAKGWYC